MANPCQLGTGDLKLMKQQLLSVEYPEVMSKWRYSIAEEADIAENGLRYQ